jgi:hypothetical protein
VCNIILSLLASFNLKSTSGFVINNLNLNLTLPSRQVFKPIYFKFSEKLESLERPYEAKTKIRKEGQMVRSIFLFAHPIIISVN